MAAIETIPSATYRLQLNKDFGFADVERITPYLGKLGISHVYLSPVLKARAGSTHGYDTVDHTLINPELGTIEEFRQMAGLLREHNIGIILDIVPNHMGVGGSDNPYWLDLLEWGRDSRYADWFDVNWSPSEPSLQNKVLAPVLGCSFGEAVASGRLELRYDSEAGSFAAWAEDTHKLPIDPRHYGDILKGALEDLGQRFGKLSGPEGADALKAELAKQDKSAVEATVSALNADRQALQALFERQNWRAARYSVAADDINYRRFFIVSDLGAIRIERDEVFDQAHRLIFQLVEEGWVQGLRVDHIDGLFDPKQYALRLRERCPKPIYLVVEKILAPHEPVRADWRVDGTTGYEFANAAVQLLIDPAAEQQFTSFYAEFIGRTDDLDKIEREAKLEIVDYEMAAELDALTTRLCEIAKGDTATSDLTRNGIRNGLRHLVASMPVYRTYMDGEAVSEEDRRNLEVALEEAKRMAPTLDPAIFAFLEQVASGALTRDGDAVIETAKRLQQFTGPVMAKGLEDTTLYRYNRFIALNDVGQRPDRFGSTQEHFHDFNRSRAADVPNGMLTSSSHDTKRGEDVRARIAALTLVPDEWFAAAQRWRSLLSEAGATPIDPADLYYLFQQLVGSWPAELIGAEVDEEALATFRERSVAAMTKAVREARLHTNWTAPNERYEEAVTRTIELMLQVSGPIFKDFRSFAERIAELGARNGIVAATLKLTSPGMPDIYQGAELHELSMVDPDNRRPVDFALRERLLETAATVIDLATGWSTGAAKLGVIQRLLTLRKELPDLFGKGSYEPVETGSDRAVAFVRRHDGDAVLVVAWVGQPGEAAGTLQLPQDLAVAEWRSVLENGDVRLELEQLLAELPVAVLRLS